MSYSGTMNIISFWQINMMVVKSLVGTSRTRKIAIEIRIIVDISAFSYIESHTQGECHRPIDPSLLPTERGIIHLNWDTNYLQKNSQTRRSGMRYSLPNLRAWLCSLLRLSSVCGYLLGAPYFSIHDANCHHSFTSWAFCSDDPFRHRIKIKQPLSTSTSNYNLF